MIFEQLGGYRSPIQISVSGDTGDVLGHLLGHPAPLVGFFEATRVACSVYSRSYMGRSSSKRRSRTRSPGVGPEYSKVPPPDPLWLICSSKELDCLDCDCLDLDCFEAEQATRAAPSATTAKLDVPVCVPACTQCHIRPVERLGSLIDRLFTNSGKSDKYQKKRTVLLL